jgi:hypothetical protein
MKLVAALALVVSCLVAAAPAEAATRKCRSITVTFRPVGEGSATFLRATNVSCARARRVAALCLHGSHAGWQISVRPHRRAGADSPRIVLARASARVSFEVAGGGGCGPTDEGSG